MEILQFVDSMTLHPDLTSMAESERNSESNINTGFLLEDLVPKRVVTSGVWN